MELATLPAATDQSAAAKAERADEARGATAVGVIAQTDFRVTPTPPAGDYVIYAGSYTTRTAAEQGLIKLNHRFPAATVIEVQTLATPTKGAGRVLTKTRYGQAHQVTNYKPSSSALAQGEHR